MLTEVLPCILEPSEQREQAWIIRGSGFDCKIVEEFALMYDTVSIPWDIDRR